MSEAIQQLILQVLDKNEIINDTRELTLPGQSSVAATQDDQLAIIAALNSLLSRNVIAWIAMYECRLIIEPDGCIPIA